jgi:uncharacterized membrane protein YtjA (UPF0391 family)
MLRLAILFLVIALIASFSGFGVVATYAWGLGMLLVMVFLVLAVLSYLGGVLQRRSFWR